MAENNELKVYGFCDAKCKHRVLTIDQTVALIQEMAANGFQVPEGYIPTTAVNGIVEQNTGKVLKLWLGTQKEWDNWTGNKTDVFAILGDDLTLQELQSAIDEINKSVEGVNKSLENIISGKTPVSVLKNDNTMAGLVQDENGVVKMEDLIVSFKKPIFSGDAKITLSESSTSATIPLTLTLEEGCKYKVEGYTISVSNNNTKKNHFITNEFIYNSDIFIYTRHTLVDVFGTFTSDKSGSSSQGSVICGLSLREDSVYLNIYTGNFYLAGADGSTIYYCNKFDAGTIVGITKIYKIVE